MRMRNVDVIPFFVTDVGVVSAVKVVVFVVLMVIRKSVTLIGGKCTGM